MQANLWFQQGWVKCVSGRKINDIFVVHGKVLHSFNLRASPLKPWILIHQTGKILAAHCECTIGLLETCSHVGATLFALEDIQRKFLNKQSLSERKLLIDIVFENMANDDDKLLRIRQLTTSQADGAHWIVFRRGRITASVFKEACHTSLQSPSISLIKKICYDNEIIAAIQYGKKNEARAYEKLFASVFQCHTNTVKKNWSLSRTGLVIPTEHPYLGASPDGIIECDCHGTIVVEIKCPNSARNDEDFTDTLLHMTNPFILMNEREEIVLNCRHKYYYQVLAQTHIFAVATPFIQAGGQAGWQAADTSTTEEEKSSLSSGWQNSVRFILAWPGLAAKNKVAPNRTYEQRATVTHPDRKEVTPVDNFIDFYNLAYKS
ncbi:uncharacterized protein LOC131425609 [Malaya genurostris]|uniref:uncharacterized protein LOC131425609 n=1 Tax=Malaya genurostris TaxID=325434 RepID=UPI0026F383F8|nr:uncharacterized protein LOC131425609 [Malaya genurostris]